MAHTNGSPDPARTIDPITLRVLSGAFTAAAKEMAHVLYRMSYSSIIRESEDLGAGLYDAGGDEICESDTSPMHVGSLPAYIRGFLKRLDGNINDGDVILHNHPYHGSTHTPDLAVAVPVFWDGRLIGFAAVTAHLLDMGGAAPGLNVDVVDVWAESRLFNGIKLYNAGVKNEDLWQFFPDNSDPAAPLARRDRLFAQFIALVAHGKAQVKLFDRIIAGVFNQAGNRVEAVLAVSAAPVALVDLQIDPVLAFVFLKAAVAQKMDVSRIARTHLVRHGLGQRQIHPVGQILDLIEAAETGARKARIEDCAFRRNDLDRSENALVLGHGIRKRGFVEQNAAHDDIRGDQGAALIRHVVAGRDFRAGAGQVNRQVAAFDLDADAHGQRLVAVAPVIVQILGRGGVLAVGDFFDLGPQHALGVVHQLMGGIQHRLHAVLFDQAEETLAPQLTGRNH